MSDATMPALPAGLSPYFRTVSFTEDSVPDALQRHHTTKIGTWARIVVESGAIGYRIEGEEGAFTLKPGTDGIIAPTIPHALEVMGPVRFYIEFFSEPDETPAEAR